MAWNKSGAERVKSYRVYQELETRYNEALEEIADLRTAINVKDELIRRLAGELANIQRPAAQRAETGHTEHRAASGLRPAARPGSYSSVQDGTAEYDDEMEPEPIDGLTHLRTPGKKGASKLS